MSNENLKCLDCNCKLENESDSFLECPKCHKIYEYDENSELKKTDLYNFDKFKCPKCGDVLIDNMFEYGICSGCGSIHTKIEDLK